MKDLTKLNETVKSVKSTLPMPITKTHVRAYRYIMNYKPLTSWDLKRFYVMVNWYNESINAVNNGKNEKDNLLGFCVELGTHRPTSTIVRVRSKNDSDSWLKVEERTKCYRLEVKTNGGMVQDLFELPNRTIAKTLIHYYLDYDVRPSKKNPTGIRRIEFITTLEHFLNVLVECNAISRNPYKDNDFTEAVNIRPDNAKMFKRFIADMEIGAVLPYDRRMIYTKDDFNL